MIDAYEVCARIAGHVRKNGCFPKRAEIEGTDEEIGRLEANGILYLTSLYEGGPKVVVQLTPKGYRMATEAPNRRRRPHAKPR